MNNTLLITLGCSWTFGVGAHWVPGMDLETFRKDAWNNDLADQLSWRALISKQNNWSNHNLACGGSSNQAQSRFAKQYFSGEIWKYHKQKYKNIRVLWGITSTGRTELWNDTAQDLTTFFYDGPKKIHKEILVHFFNHQNEIRLLSLEITFWNEFFRNAGVDNYWFDTFNHHDYNWNWPKHQEDYNKCAGPDWPSWDDYLDNNFDGVAEETKQEILDPAWGIWAQHRTKIDRVIDHDKRPRDVLSALANKFNVTSDGAYHASAWQDDCNRISGLVPYGVLNPYSFHPSRYGHELIAQWFTEKIPSWF